MQKQDEKTFFSQQLGPNAYIQKIMIKVFVSFSTSKNLIVDNTKFPYCHIHKYTWTSPDGITHNNLDHILVDNRRQSSIIDVPSLRGADCDADYYIVFATIRVSLSLKNGLKQYSVADRIKLNKLLDHETRKEYKINVGNRFLVLEA